MDIYKDKILSYCEFTDDTAYVLLLLARKKENPQQLESQKERRAVRFLIRSEEDVDFALEEVERRTSLYPEVVYRLYVSVNQRSLVKGMAEFQKRIIDLQYGLICENNETYNTIGRLGSEWKSVLANKKCRAQRRFLFDIDLPPTEKNTKIVAAMRAEIPVQEYFFGLTNSGMALVTDPFNIQDITLPDSTEVKSDSYLYITIFNKKGKHDSRIVRKYENGLDAERWQHESSIGHWTYALRSKRGYSGCTRRT